MSRIEIFSIIPFDLGLTAVTFDLTKRALCRVYEVAPQLPLLPEAWTCLEHKNREASLFMHKNGFGCFVVKGFSEDRPFTEKFCMEALQHRREYHTKAVGSQGIVNELVSEVRSAVFREIPAKRRRRRPPLLWSTCPYVLSMFSVLHNESIDNRSDSLTRKLAILAEPSLVGVEDTVAIQGQTVAATSIRSIGIKVAEAVLDDSDITQEASVFITWAGVVMAANSEAALEQRAKEMIALEVRLQTAWTMMHYINCWKPLAIECLPDAHDIRILKQQYSTMVEVADDLTDPTLSTRLKVIFERLLHTSDFKTERDKAQRGIRSTDELAELASSEATKRYMRIVEACLFVFAFGQIIPLFYKVPLVTLDRIWLAPPLLAVGAILIAHFLRK